MAEEREDKGFVIKDRRRVSLDDSEKKAEERPASAGEAAEEAGAKTGGREAPTGETGAKEEEIPFPEVSLATFVFSLSSSALMHLGEIPEPGASQVKVDLPLAKQIIDTLGMLQEKTKGNLDPDEDRLLRSILYDLRMKYIQKSGK